MKRKLFSLSLLSCAILALQAESWSQWVQTSGPPGGRILTLAYDPEGANLFAGTFCGDVYRSTNDGAAWSRAARGLPYAPTNALTFCTGAMFAGTEAGLFVSTDDGNNWSESSAGLTNTDVQALTTLGTIVFAGTDGGGIFRSTDGGVSWTAVNGGMEGDYPSTHFVTALAAHGTHLFAGTGSGVFVSPDSGTHWYYSLSGVWGTAIEDIVALDSCVFFATSLEIYRTTNNGAQWTRTDIGLEDIAVKAFAVSGTKLIAGTSNDGVFYSTDMGETWIRVKSDPKEVSLRAVAARCNTILAAYFDGGINRSTDFGEHWSDASASPANTYVKALAVNGTDLFAGTYGDGRPGGLFLSSDTGTHWASVGAGQVCPNISALATRGDELFAGTNFGVYRSTDRGACWEPVNDGLWYSGGVPSLLAVGSDLYAGIDGHGVFLSTDGGSTWTDAGAGLHEALYSPFVTALAANSEFIYAGTLGGVYRSPHGGNDWQPATEGMGSQWVTALKFCGSDLFAGSGSFGVYRSTDGGSTWVQVNTGLVNNDIHALEVHGTNVFAGTWGAGVFFTDDHGSSWHPCNTGMENARIASLTILGPDLVAGTYTSGVWRQPLSEALPVQLASFGAESDGHRRVRLHWSTLSEKNNYGFRIQESVSPPDYRAVTGAWIPGHGTTATPHDYAWIDTASAPGTYYRLEQIDLDGTSHFTEGVRAEGPTGVPPGSAPAGYVLEQNFPNPFNPSTTIQYGLPRRSHVTIALFNGLGQQVALLVDDVYDAGYHSVRYDGVGVASGVYFCRMKAEGFVQTRRLMMIR